MKPGWLLKLLLTVQVLAYSQASSPNVQDPPTCSTSVEGSCWRKPNMAAEDSSTKRSFSMTIPMEIDIDTIVDLSVEAGKKQLEIYAQDIENWDATDKSDGSPLTRADTESNAIIVKALNKLYPHIPIVSEENKLVDYSVRKNYQYFWVVDPLDGTKEFLKRNGQFTVNIGLVRGQTPIFGVVHVPVQDVTYYGAEGVGAYKVEKGNTKRIETAEFSEDDEKLVVVASASHRNQATNDFIAKYKNCTLQSMGSSLKLLLVAEGSAHVYPRVAPTCEWDTCAAHAVVKYAGGEVLQVANDGQTVGTDVVYGKENVLNPYFIVFGKRKLAKDTDVTMKIQE